MTGGSDSRTGGILGYDMGKAAITDCYNTGLISGANYAGGIRGYLSTLAGKITNCYSAGTVTGKTTGAIAPKDLYDGENCYVVTGGSHPRRTARRRRSRRRSCWPPLPMDERTSGSRTRR